MENQDYSCLRLDNQLCFPLYACSKEIIKRYKPFLDELDLTYTQYITMMVLWERKEMNVKELGEHLYLDSGTLTPLLKKLEAKGYITRQRMKTDERNVLIQITQAGEYLKEDAVHIPGEMSQCVNLEPQEAKVLYILLRKILKQLKEEEAMERN
ncbi:MAG: MarR family transcriptional regulator [Treponema sp.]|nr:MarR family transcriptional regulator [Treponema sp.]MEE3312537.1 MarR family transcriptional regulator [Treponema sp.]